MKLSQIKANPNNPRVLRDEKFQKLKKSIEDFPKMMELRPIVIDENNTILGGNMRFRVLQDLGYKEIEDSWVKKANELTEKQKQEFIIKDNVSFGEWNWDDLANEWDVELLNEWSLHVPIFHDNLSNNDAYAGASPDSELETFMNAEIKRLYLAYDSDTYAKVVDWFSKKIEQANINTYSEYILKLMENDYN